jgi:CheY-like chemotaxis protein
MSTISPMRVLVVDDCEDAAITMAFLLKRYGHEAVAVTSGEAALQQAPVFRPDVMFIDLAMPQIDGCSVARQLRQTADFAETPLVAVSGYVDAEHQTQATAAGFTEYLPKPYPIEVLQALMERIAARVKAACTMAQTSPDAAAQTRELNEQSRLGLDDYWH